MARTLVVEYWRCEMHRTLHFNVDRRIWEDMKQAINKLGINVEEKELSHDDWIPTIFCPDKIEEVVRSVFEVQGLKYEEGVSFLETVELLVANYAKVK